MGRSRGGPTTKIHALVDAEGRPIRLKLTEGQAHDGRSAADMLDTVEPGNILLADRASDSDALREEMNGHGAWANVRANATPSSASSQTQFHAATSSPSSVHEVTRRPPALLDA